MWASSPWRGLETFCRTGKHILKRPLIAAAKVAFRICEAIFKETGVDVLECGVGVTLANENRR